MLAVCVSSLSQNTATSTRWAGTAFPDLGVDAGEVDPFVEPMADPFIAGVGGEVRKAEVLVVPRLQPISPDHLHSALLVADCQEPNATIEKIKPRAAGRTVTAEGTVGIPATDN
jgi:hypothetical protein